MSPRTGSDRPCPPGADYPESRLPLLPVRESPRRIGPGRKLHHGTSLCSVSSRGDAAPRPSSRIPSPSAARPPRPLGNGELRLCDIYRGGARSIPLIGSPQPIRGIGFRHPAGATDAPPGTPERERAAARVDVVASRAPPHYLAALMSEPCTYRAARPSFVVSMPV